MAKQDGTQITMSVEELQKLITGSQTTQATPPSDPEDAFARSAKLRDKAEAMAHQHHWRAFRSPNGAVGVAYITQSKEHDSGRVQKFDSYVRPPTEQMSKYEGRERFDHRGNPTPHYAAWIWNEYQRADTISFVGGAGAALPDVGPPRASVADCEKDVEERVARRDADFSRTSVHKDPMVRHELKPLPAVEPVK